MEGPRPPFEKEYPTVLHFVTDSLRPQSSWSISDEYPTAFHPMNLNNIRVIFDEDKVVSHALLKPLIVNTPAISLKVGLIGSVVTASSHRQQGLSRQILEDCLKNAAQQECDLALLWTDIPDFYRKLGFEYLGTENQFLIDKPLPTSARPSLLLNKSQISSDAVHHLYRKHSVQTQRSADDIARFMKIPNSHVYTAWSSENQLLAYAVEGKGADLQNHIHEWGGNIPELFALLNFIRTDSQKNPRLLVPSHSKNLIRHLTAAGLSRVENFLGMGRIVRPDLFALKISKMAKNLGLRDLSFSWNDPHFLIRRVHAQGSSQTILSEVNLLKMAFGPWPPSETGDFDKETIAALNKLFPLPFWMWGWDSI